MNKSNLKTYAPQARRDFIDMVTSRAAQLGIAEQNGELKVENSLVQGEVLVIAGQAFPVKIELLRKRLLERIRQQGFSQTMEAIAYTWFNRFAALRYIELHDYLEHGQRVLSSVSAGGLPDILTHALDLAEAGELPTISRDMVAELKLSNKDGELYKRLLVAQCNKLATAMPFLFEKIDDDSELLLPDTLLRTDSVIRKLVDGIPEDDWQQVEVIGWLYQFYISEKKDQVIGKVVKSEDIPAATQLFTPNWIVKYLVQNSIGRLWLMANPHSGLASQMEYYIQPAEQTPEVQAQLDALIKVRVEEDGETLSPLSITVLDPACGSGHILVEAYDLLKAIYLERGYKLRDIPRLILKHNLFGLDIDDRAAQLAGFALLMKARADDRKLFENTPELNVLAIQDSKGVDDAVMSEAVMQAAIRLEGGDVLGNRDLFGGAGLVTEHSSGLKVADVRELIRFFEYGKTFGSLLMVSETLAGKLATLGVLLEQVIKGGDSLAKSYALQIQSDYLKPAEVLSKVYDAVVANPPYMGSNFYSSTLKSFVNKEFKISKSDLYSAFIERNIFFLKKSGYLGMITIPNWMFLSSFDELRNLLCTQLHIDSFVHNGRGVWGSDFGSCSFVLRNINLEGAKGVYKRLFDKQGSVASNEELNQRYFDWPNFYAATDDFKKIPGSPIAYWLSEKVRGLFSRFSSIDDFAISREGMTTANNDMFLRFWHEIPHSNIGWNIASTTDALASKKIWFPYIKGGDYRKWYGNIELVVNWKNDGEAIKNNIDLNTGRVRSHNYNGDFAFKSGFTWTLISSATTAARFIDDGFMFDANGPMAFAKDINKYLSVSLINSNLGAELLKALSPTLAFKHGHILSLPALNDPSLFDRIKIMVDELVRIAREDWDASETSWGFSSLKMINVNSEVNSLKSSFSHYLNLTERATDKTKVLEEKIGQLLTNACGLESEIDSTISLDRITLRSNFMHRYSSEPNNERKLIKFQEAICCELISYAIGNMMGRYSLNETGLIYAHANNIGFDPTRYTTFPADADGILPITDILWFADDAANRVREFLLAVWGGGKGVRDQGLGIEEQALATIGQQCESANSPLSPIPYPLPPKPYSLNNDLLWLADSLGRKSEETPEEAIRRYIATSFYKDHLQTYKKRPIYWLFSSGKHKAFEALVYLHRYNEGTLSRMRTEYVVPLTGKMNDRIRFLETEVPKATSTAERKKLEKDIDRLKKKLDELRLYDEKLRHYADRRIALDLDDGVKVNYGKFGDLLAEVKAITGGSDD